MGFLSKLFGGKKEEENTMPADMSADTAMTTPETSEAMPASDSAAEMPMGTEEAPASEEKMM